jgi:hypothetical protein
MDDDRPYRVDGSKVWLSPDAKYWAEQYFGPGRKGLEQMAKYLLNRDRLGDDFEASGEVADQSESEPQSTAVAREDFLPNVAPSENIEDRRNDPRSYDPTMKHIWKSGEDPWGAPRVQTFHPGPLPNALGFRDIGKSPQQIPQFYGPGQPSYPAAFGNFYQKPPLLPFD